MKSKSMTRNRSKLLWIVVTASAMFLAVRIPSAAAQQSWEKKASTTNTAGAKAFDTPEQAADTLVDAAEKFDQVTLGQIFGPQGEDIIFTGEVAQDRQRASDFAAQAREKKVVSWTRRQKLVRFLSSATKI